MKISSLLYCFFCAEAFASLDVSLPTGNFRGVTTLNGTETWFGIPYAQAPIGDLRFKAPVAITTNSSTLINATTFGYACPQIPVTALTGSLGANISEDCLTLNVWRPQGTTADSSLPVLVWIYGGSYHTGAASEPLYDPTRLIQRSVDTGKSIIVVSFNYRLNTFGFIASKTMQPEDLNAGLLDQRLALEFIQDNIAFFGGDSTKVTLWGQSAGAGSAEAHILYPSPNRSLFRAVIADSSVGPFKNSPGVDVYDESGMPFALLLSATDCNDLECLRKLPFEKLMNVSNTLTEATLNDQLWEPVIGPSRSFAPVRASAKIKANDFLHVPYIGGSNLNDGSLFSISLYGLGLSGNAEDDAFDTFVRKLLIDNSTIDQSTLDTFHALWSANDTSLGAPFNTGDSLYDRSSAFYTDEFMLAPRRLFLEHASVLQPTWAYLFADYISGNPEMLGVFHGSELELLLGDSYVGQQVDFANQYMNYYINFVNDMNPGDDWPQYTNDARNVLKLISGNITVIPDIFDSNRTTFLNSEYVLNQFEK